MHVTMKEGGKGRGKGRGKKRRKGGRKEEIREKRNEGGRERGREAKVLFGFYFLNLTCSYDYNLRRSLNRSNRSDLL